MPVESMETPRSHQFRVPPIVHAGAGAIAQLPGVLHELGIRRATLVTDRVMGDSEWVGRLASLLGEADVDMSVFDDIDREPTTREVEAALEAIRAAGATAVVAFGGGSALDTAKSAAALARNDGRMPDFEGLDRFAHDGLPVIAIPTTAGTGSEATRAVAVTDADRDVKMLITSWRLVPAAAIVDPEPMLTMPPAVTASTGIDALTHAIESYVSRRRQPITDALALDAMRRLPANLVRSFDVPDDLAAREQTAIAAMHAGMAFSNASVALVHGMSRPIGAHFHVPHGLSNAMLLPTVMGFSLEGDVERYADVAEAIGAARPHDSPEAAAREGLAAVRALCARLKVPSPVEWGIDAADFVRVAPQMARDAIASGSPGNNPRTASEEQIVQLYREVVSPRAV